MHQSVGWSVAALLLLLSLAAWTREHDTHTPAAKPTADTVREFATTISESVQRSTDFDKKDDVQLPPTEWVPTTIAVLPAAGAGDDDERSDITYAIHNQLGTSQFTLRNPQNVQEKLDALESRTIVPFLTADPARLTRLAKTLGVDGLLLIKVDQIEPFFGGAYAHYKIVVTCTLHSASRNDTIWTHTETVIEREVGIPLDPLSIIKTVTAAARLFSTAKLQQLVDQLARKIARKIPKPPRNKPKPPHIEYAASNAEEGPFRSGREFMVSVRAEPGLDAELKIAGLDAVTLQEGQPGQYAGRYVVRPGDDLDESVVEIEALRPKDGSRRHWRMAGRVGFDTRKPGTLADLNLRADHSGLLLEWSAMRDEGTEIRYHIERADVETSQFDLLAEIPIYTYLDRTTEPDTTYIYRVTPVDAAGNKGGSATATVTMVRPGPTDFTESNLSAGRWSALGSPYRLAGRIMLGPAEELVLEPGTVVEFAPETRFLVRGRLYVEGEASAPVHFQGDRYTVQVGGLDTTGRPWRNLKQNGAGAELHLTRTKLHMKASHLNGIGISLGNGSRLTMTRSVIANADTAVRIQGGQLVLDNSHIVQSTTAIDVGSVVQHPAVSGVNGRLSQNRIHIRSSSPLTVVGVALDEVDLDTALAKLSGAVTIDWQSLSGPDNLERARFARDWRGTIPLLQSRQWHEVIEALQGRTRDDTGNDTLTVLLWMTGQERPRAQSSVSEFLLPVKDAILNGTSLTLWLQEVHVPSNNTLLGSNIVILKQAIKGFTGAYLDDHFKHKRRTTEYVRATRLPLHEAVISSRVGFRYRQGLMDTVWVYHVINRKLLNHKLSVAGLVERKRPDFTLAVAVDGDDSRTLTNSLFRLFDQQNIAFMDLSGLRPGRRIETAKTQNADLLLSARMTSTEGTSTLADSLKVIDVEIDMKLEELKRGSIVKNYHHATRTTAFKKQQGLNKAVTQGLQRISDSLLADLFSHSR